MRGRSLSTGRFDGVISTFGVMFAIDQARAGPSWGAYAAPVVA